MKSKSLCLLLGLGLSGTSHAQAPTARSRTITASEAGPAVSGNLLNTSVISAAYGFDCPGLNDGKILAPWTDTAGVSFPSVQVYPGQAGLPGGRATGGFANGTGNQDSAHPNLVMTSPPFQLEDRRRIRFSFYAGQGSANLPANLTAATTFNGGTSSATGFQGVGLRRLSDNAYVAHRRRYGNANSYQENGFSSATLAVIKAANPGATYVLDFIDNYSGGFGYVGIDNVEIAFDAAEVLNLVSPPTVVLGASAFGGSPEGTLSDPFAYNPLSPANPLPYQAFSTSNGGSGFHNNDAVGTSGDAILEYSLVTPAVDGADNKIVVDIYGRNANVDRDNNIDVAFLDGSGAVLGQVTGAIVSDAPPRFVRVSSQGVVADGSTVAKIRITAHDSDADPLARNAFFLAEIRAASVRSNFNYQTDLVTVAQVAGSSANVGVPVVLPSGAQLTVAANGDYSYNANGALVAPTTDNFGFTVDYGPTGTGGTTSSNTVTVNITKAGTVVYVDDSWAGMNAGDPIADADAGTAGAQPATFGTNAFATIGKALFAANDSTTVIVNDGTYNEVVGVSGGKTLRVTGADAASTVTVSGVCTSIDSTVNVQGSSVLNLMTGTFGTLTGSGSVNVSPAGSLALIGNASGYTGALLIGDGSRLSGEGTIGGTLTLGTTLGAILVINDTTSARLVSNNLVLNGTNTVEFVGGVPSTAGPTAVIEHTGGITGTPGTNLVLAAQGFRTPAWADTGGVVTVGLSGLVNTWTGADGLFWDVVGVSPIVAASWSNSSGSTFYQFDQAVFNDAGAGSIGISTLVLPTSTTFNNTLGNDFVFLGQPIGGNGNLTLNGTGTVTLQNANSYTGVTTVSNGRLVAAGGAPGATFRGTSALNVSAGGTLELGGTNIFVPTHGTPLVNSRVITVNAATLLMNETSDFRFGNVTLTNSATWTSNRTLAAFDALLGNTDTGAANVNVTGTGASIMNGTGGIHIQGVQNFNVANTTGDAAVDLDVSMILGTQGNAGGAAGGIRKTGAGTMRLSAANLYAGTTDVTAGRLSITNPYLNDASTVNINTGAVLDLDFVGNDKVGVLTINGGLPLPNGTYGAGHPTYGSFFSGSGIIQIGDDDYATWAAAFLPADVSNKTGDNDNDGLLNRDEYAFGLNPTSGSSVNPITVQLDKASGTFSYTRRDPALSKLTYSVWTSTNLISWTKDPTAVQTAGPTGVDGNQTVMVTLSSPPTGTRFFVRVLAD